MIDTRMLTRKLLRVLSQRPRWLSNYGILLFALAILVMTVWADSHWLLTVCFVVPLVSAGAFCLGYADRLERERQQRALKTAEIERELGL